MTRELHVIQPTAADWMTTLEAGDHVWLVKERQVARIVVQFIFQSATTPQGWSRLGSVGFCRVTFSLGGIVSNAEQTERWICDANGRGGDYMPLFLPTVWIERPRGMAAINLQPAQFSRDLVAEVTQALQRRSRHGGAFILEPMPADVPLPPGMLEDLAIQQEHTMSVELVLDPLPEPLPEPIRKTRFTMGDR